MKRELYELYFKGKKVTVLGLGLLGRGVGDTVFMASQGSLLTVTDKKTKKELAPSLQSLKEYEDITYVLGGHRLQDFEEKDFIMKAAGVPADSEFILHARRNGIPVYMSAALVSRIAKDKCEGVTIIGVTGTRGKSTTTELIAHILKEAGKRAHLGGNIRGMANLPLLESIGDGDCLVLELDSWQLQGFGDLKLSPDIAIFTSFLDDHLNYYKGDREAYFWDKAQVFINQQTPCLIASAQARDEIRKRTDADMVVPEVKRYDAHIIGIHNDVSISLAVEAAVRAGLTKEEAEKHAGTFKPVEGRLQNMGIVQGVTVYNDNNATTPDATIAGIEAVYGTHGVKPIVIMGGSDKNLPLEKLEETVREKAKACVLLAGTGTEKLTLPKTNMRESLEDCVTLAFEVASPGDVILFSPGFASFSPYFQNEYERNDAFMREVENMQKQTL
jgi:UDP-N-acetylmuramoylalanine--D-glutamate ligase